MTGHGRDKQPAQRVASEHEYQDSAMLTPRR